MKTAAKLITAGVATVALAGGIGVGIASADPTSSPSTTPTASATPSASPTKSADKKAGRADKKRDLTKKALHGELTLGGKKHRVVVFQRGTVAKVSATSVTVKSTDGFTATYALNATTKVRKDKQAAKVTDIVAADRVRIVATRQGDRVTAQKIGDAGPK